MPKIYTIIDERQHDCTTIMLLAQCTMCPKLFTGVSGTPENANRLILRKARKHWAKRHGSN